MTAARPAATVVLVRRAGDDDLEVLLVRRGDRGAFGGVWAFPGGRVEPDDDDPDAPGDELAAGRRAAARETEEEVGVALDPASFVAVSHWTPPLDSPRRFTTWFFLAEAPAGCEPVADGEEIAEHRWTTPEAALAARDGGELLLVPPTWVTLRQLAGAGSVDAALAAAREREPERFETRIAEVADGRVALWHGDAGYASGDAGAAGPRHRLTMTAAAPWRYEREA